MKIFLCLAVAGISLLVGIPLAAARERTPVIHETELREFLRTAWDSGDPGLISSLIAGIGLFTQPDEAVEMLDHLVRTPQVFPYSTRVQALHALADVMPGDRFGPYAQQLFLESREGAFQREIIRLLGKTDNWIPFLWSIAGGSGLEEHSELERAYMRIEAFHALARWQVLEALPVLFRFLGLESLPPPIFAEVEAFLMFYDNRAYPYLSACLQSTDPRLRRAVIPSLARMGMEGRDAVSGMLRDPEPDIREKALLELILADPAGMERVSGIIDSADRRLWCLMDAWRASQGEGRDVPCLEEYTDRSLLRILAGTEAGMEWLIRSTRGDRERERRLVHALAEIPGVFPYQGFWFLLEKMDFPPGPWVTVFDPEFLSAEILPRLDTRPDLLVGLVENDIPLNREIMASQIYRLRNLLRSEGEERYVRAVVRSLVVLGDEALPLLEPVLTTSSEPVAVAVVQVLRRLDSEATVRFLERLLDHPSTRVQVLARLAFLEFFERNALRLIWLAR